jgi:Ca2+-binding EF-hand superfamily protein
MKDNFQLYDKDGNGVITLENNEFNQLLHFMGLPPLDET